MGQDGTASLRDGLKDLDTIGLSRPVPQQPLYLSSNTPPTYKDTKDGTKDTMDQGSLPEAWHMLSMVSVVVGLRMP